MNNEMLKTIDEDKLDGVAGGGAADLILGWWGAVAELGANLVANRVQGTADAFSQFASTVSGLAKK